MACGDHLGGLHRGLAEVAGHQLRAVHLDELALAEQAEGSVDAGDQPRHGGLAGAGVADEDQVPGDGRLAQPGLGAQLLDPQNGGLAVDLGLDRAQPDQVVELGEQLLEGLGGLVGLGRIGGRLCLGDLGLLVDLFRVLLGLLTRGGRQARRTGHPWRQGDPVGDLQPVQQTRVDRQRGEARTGPVGSGDRRVRCPGARASDPPSAATRTTPRRPHGAGPPRRWRRCRSRSAPGRRASWRRRSPRPRLGRSRPRARTGRPAAPSSLLSGAPRQRRARLAASKKLWVVPPTTAVQAAGAPGEASASAAAKAAPSARTSSSGRPAAVPIRTSSLKAPSSGAEPTPPPSRRPGPVTGCRQGSAHPNHRRPATSCRTSRPGTARAPPEPARRGGSRRPRSCPS